MQKASEWVKGGNHLPPFLKDFHDQKDIFKAIDEWANRNPEDYYTITFSQAQVYTVDSFLRYMGLCGYTLQKNRSKVKFFDLDTVVTEATRKRQEISMNLLNEIMKKPVDSVF